MTQPELLAPAGSMNALRAGINAGADAVYVGGKLFSARASAVNFDIDELISAIEFCHIRGKKLFLALNTLLFDNEIEQLYSYINRLYTAGLDAVIVQDLGVFNFLRTQFPKLELHASTQVTLQSLEGVNLIQQLGAARAVLSRELTLDEIAYIKTNSNIELECFVHGALCYSYSGQCLFSSMLGGRSGNRGRCAQPCRLPYNVICNDKILNSTNSKYILSPKDICTISILPKLLSTGIDSLKIEGRMKRAEYVAGVVSIYRKYIDLYLNNPDKYEVSNSDIQNLMDLYNRGSFSLGYYMQKNTPSQMSLNRPNHQGVNIGEVESSVGNKMNIRLNKDISIGDEIEITNIKESFDFRLNSNNRANDLITVSINNKLKMPKGTLIYRTKNQELLNSIAEKYIAQDTLVEIEAKTVLKQNCPIELTFTCEDISINIVEGMCEAATKTSVTKENIADKINKLGGTPFYLSKIDIIMDNNLFVPMSVLNNIRRKGIELLYKAILEKSYRESEDMLSKPIKEKKTSSDTKDMFIVSVSTQEQLDTVLANDKISEIYLQFNLFARLDSAKLKKCAEAHRIYVVLPPVARKDTISYILKYKDILAGEYIYGISIKLLDQLIFAKQFGKEIVAEGNVYSLNTLSKLQLNELGINHFTASYEMNYEQLSEQINNEYDLTVYGYTPLMVSTQCINKNLNSCDHTEKLFYLEDRYNKSFPARNLCDVCCNVIYNSSPLLLSKQINAINKLNKRALRMDFTIEDSNETQKIIDIFVNGLESEIKNYTNGHFKRGVE